MASMPWPNSQCTRTIFSILWRRSRCRNVTPREGSHTKIFHVRYEALCIVFGNLPYGESSHLE